jgi:hypothetical protein
LEVFEQEMKNFFEIFLIIFDQKSLNHVIWIFKEHMKNMWSPSPKVKVAILFEINSKFRKNPAS